MPKNPREQPYDPEIFFGNDRTHAFPELELLEHRPTFLCIQCGGGFHRESVGRDLPQRVMHPFGSVVKIANQTFPVFR